MAIEMQVKIKDEKTTHTERDIVYEPFIISKENRELVDKVERVYNNFVKAQQIEGDEAPEITLKFKTTWQR